MASVKVAVRVRPFNKRELDLRCQNIIRMNNVTTTILPKDGGGTKEGKSFSFDHSYWSFDPDDPHYTSQQKVFDDVGQEVVESAFDGYNASIFAYGQTGSGKTYTMMGHQGCDGLIPRICKALFQRMSASTGDTKYNVEVSYLEIYNEKVRDLLSNSHQLKKTLRIREHPTNGPYVEGLSRHVVLDYEDILDLMKRGNLHRTTASTNMNDTSSRSHAIFTLTFSQASFSEETERVSRLHLVDLAGSERANSSGAVGVRLKEGAHINQSLVALGTVISALAEKSLSHKRHPARDFIPYRNSILTWLLKDSLGGNSKTLMIANVSPADCNHAETMSTLIYANRAKNIINKPTVNEDPNVRLIRDLKEEIAHLQSLLKTSVTSPSKTPVMEQIQQHEAKVKELQEEWTEKWKETHSILKEQRALGLRKSGGHGVVLDSEKPHLIGVDGDWFSTGLTLYPLSKECTLIGTAEAKVSQDIVLEGPGILPEHCSIRMSKNGVVTLVPEPGAKCTVNDVPVTNATVLSQGTVLLLGDGHQFRYNNPVEVEQLKRSGDRSHRNSLNLSRLSLLSPSMGDLYRATAPSETDSPIGRQDISHEPSKSSLLEEATAQEDSNAFLNKETFSKALTLCYLLISQSQEDCSSSSIQRELERHLENSGQQSMKEVQAKVLRYLEGLPELISISGDTSQEEWAHQLTSYLSEHSFPRGGSSTTTEDCCVSPTWSSLAPSTPTQHSSHNSASISIQVPNFHLCGFGFHSHYKYQILVSVPGERWTIFRRYKRFKELHKEMVFKMASKIQLPSLPPKKLIWSDPEQAAMERRPRLEAYLQRLLTTLHKEGLIQDTEESLCNLSDFFLKFNSSGCNHPPNFT